MNFIRKILFLDKNSKRINKKILITAGGSGGHILPALTIVESLQEINPDIQVECVHGFSDLEKEIYSQSDLVCHKFSIGRLRKNVPFKERLLTLVLLPFSLLKALIIVLRSKPNMVFGTGGSVSGPLLLAGWLLRKKTIIWEPNIVPGLTNRWLAPFMDHIIIVFNETKQFFTKKNGDEKKITQLPYPVRSQISGIPIKQNPSVPLRVLILGGSQGSFFINKVVSEVVVSSFDQPFSFVHQTGQNQFNQLKYTYANCKNVQVFSFLKDIHTFYEWADVIISRAGLGALAELSSIGRIGIIIPLESSADGHQLKNAKTLEQKEAIIMVKQQNFSTEKLKTILEDIINNQKKPLEIAENIYNFKLGSKADLLAEKLLENLNNVARF